MYTDFLIQLFLWRLIDAFTSTCYKLVPLDGCTNMAAVLSDVTKLKMTQVVFTLRCTINARGVTTYYGL